MNPGEIRKLILKVIYSEEQLLEVLVLKGGNALNLHGITNRESQDLDFSIQEEIRFTKEKEGALLEKTLTQAFSSKGYLVNDFKFEDKPKKRNADLKPFWGGYSVTFTIIDKKKYREQIEQNDPNLGRFAEPTSDRGDTKKVTIDLSFDEYTEQKESIIIDDVPIYLYTPLMIVYEKIRASCQQLDEYELVSTNKVRARDLYDIYQTLTNPKFIDLKEEVLNPNNFYILKETFRLKEVPIELLTKLESKKEELKDNYEKQVQLQIPFSDNKVNFDFLFEYCKDLFDELYLKIKNADI
ncbi:putative nucleotidyltransferase component of viral defense system [Enterococcus sp. PF1-24]|uniref:nucleotidyl transferase AbiEii/AbiGii toxin family protein n=1 Tax=unclassified Enterococcus TaxID=2608891 RepID=UPI0024768ACF|nr:MULTISPECIES: nucleotidyl transferase AbiEii/AbiGii toxin family protein [unclassified Enterococcus]MDH6365656.1 putative nucleotidyltransferase component of viral defense system [Enterococcus sp. PFB1-1]MDH6402764.1 putative nucleotidyltransferase component of viral defense system [Enterococcus sp. PF1-24]